MVKIHYEKQTQSKLACSETNTKCSDNLAAQASWREIRFDGVTNEAILTKKFIKYFGPDLVKLQYAIKQTDSSGHQTRHWKAVLLE